MKTSVRVYVAAMTGVALACLYFAGWEISATQPSVHWNAVVALLVLGFITEASYFSLRVGASQTQSAISFIPYIASYLLLDSGWAALVAAGSMASVEAIVRRKPPIKVVFNVSQQIVTVSTAAHLYHNLAGASSLTSFSLAPMAFAASVLAYFFTNSTAVSVAVALADGSRLRDSWVRIAANSLVYDLFSAPLAALLAFLYVRSQLLGVLALILPLYFLRHVYLVYLQLEQVNRDLLELMVKAIEARDPYTSGHSQRVSKIAEVLARDLGLGHKHVEQITTAALLHDVGKIHEEYAPLLRKEGKLNPTEKALMQTHAARSAELVSTISSFKGTIADAVRSHHENFDGTGYPDGLSGRGIPIGSRIIMIADTIDAMTTDRPYRRALPFEKVRQELEKYAGKQFDPELVAVCLRSDTIRGLLGARIEDQALPSTADLGDLEPRVLPAKAPLFARRQKASL